MSAQKLKATLLENASTEQQKEFAKLLAEQCVEEERKANGHKCWLFVPPDEALEAMKKYNHAPDWDRCPKCKKGRVVVEIRNWSMGQALYFKCHFNKNGCEFEELFYDCA